MIEITLPWPPSALSPNFRTHWAVKSKAAKAYRLACFTLCKEAGLVLPSSIPNELYGTLGLALGQSRWHLFLDFFPPDRRKRDDDNMIASFKSGRDGIADALKIDDTRFICHPFFKDEIGGYVKVTIGAGPYRNAK